MGEEKEKKAIFIREVRRQIKSYYTEEIDCAGLDCLSCRNFCQTILKSKERGFLSGLCTIPREKLSILVKKSGFLVQKEIP